MKFRLTPLPLLVALAVVPAASGAGTSTGPGAAIAAREFQLWNAALQSRDPGKVAALYCQPDGILIPTLSNSIRSDHAAIVDYFRHFLKYRPTGRIDKSYVRILGADVLVDSGIYTFHLVKDGRAQDVRARYTFVYQKHGAAWCIMEQHSSVMPEDSPG